MLSEPEKNIENRNYDLGEVVNGGSSLRYFKTDSVWLALIMIIETKSKKMIERLSTFSRKNFIQIFGPNYFSNKT